MGHSSDQPLQDMSQENSQYEEVNHLVERVKTDVKSLIYILDKKAEDINSANKKSILEKGFGQLLGLAGLLLMLKDIYNGESVHYFTGTSKVAQIYGVPFSLVLLLVGMLITYASEILLGNTVRAKKECEIKPFIDKLKTSSAELNDVLPNAFDAVIMLDSFQSDLGHWFTKPSSEDVSWLKKLSEYLKPNMWIHVLLNIGIVSCTIVFTRIIPIHLCYTIIDCKHMIQSKLVEHQTAMFFTETTIPILKDRLKILATRIRSHRQRRSTHGLSVL